MQSVAGCEVEFLKKLNKRKVGALLRRLLSRSNCLLFYVPLCMVRIEPCRKLEDVVAICLVFTMTNDTYVPDHSDPAILASSDIPLLIHRGPPNGGNIRLLDQIRHFTQMSHDNLMIYLDHQIVVDFVNQHVHEVIVPGLSLPYEVRRAFDTETLVDRSRVDSQLVCTSPKHHMRDVAVCYRLLQS